jgi:hypothetical protein
MQINFDEEAVRNMAAYFSNPGEIAAHVLGLVKPEVEKFITEVLKRGEIQQNYEPYRGVSSTCHPHTHVIYDTKQNQTFCANCSRVLHDGRPT